MKKFFSCCFMIVLISSCSPTKKEEPIISKSKLVDSEWRLLTPQTTKTCELLLSFHGNHKMLMKYRGESFEGYYEVDSVLTNYITINVFNKQGWDDECDVNPDYLSLYDENTQFSYGILEDRLYFQKNEKSVVFQRIQSENLEKEINQD